MEEDMERGFAGRGVGVGIKLSVVGPTGDETTGEVRQLTRCSYTESSNPSQKAFESVAPLQLSTDLSA